jgi:RNA polymerase sigma-70 factor (ECF subfamily)
VNTSTNTALLVGLRDPANEPVWREFCERYRPLLVAFGRRLGLQWQDAEDATQETLCGFVTAYRQNRYDREKGGLRAWLFRIAAHKIRDVQRRRCRERPQGEDSTTGVIDQIPDEQTLSGLWDAEWQQATLREAIRRIKGEVEPTTLQAFALAVLREWPAEKVAAKLGMSPNAVSKAKRRVLSRLREIRRELEWDW